MVPFNRRTFLDSLLTTSAVLWAQPSWAIQEKTTTQSPRLRSKLARGQSVAATVHPLATDAAIRILERGGSAIDAAVAAAVTLSVVDGHNSGIGGGCFMLIRSKNGEQLAIDGRERAPAAARPDMFLRDGKPDTQLSQTGPLACGIPGEIAALDGAHRRFGKLPWKDLFDSAIDAAENGYLIGAATLRAIQEEQKNLEKFPASAAIFLRDGKPPKLGDLLIQSDLARTLKQVAAQGSKWFYEGEFAERASTYLQSIGGIAKASDFAHYTAPIRTPLSTSYRQHRILGFPPPSSGGLHIAQMLTMLEAFPMQELYRNQPLQFYHVLAETMKLAFADRAHWLGDSDYAKVPKGLIAPEYLRDRARRIRLDAVTPVESQGTPPTSLGYYSDDRKHTTHLTIADAEGNWVAMTATVNTTWGNKVVVPQTGVMLNNQMDDFSIAPGTPNAFGLVGAEANKVEGGKRPLSSMSPTIVLNGDGIPVLTCGAAGGPKIINATLQVILRCLDLGQNIDDALAAPRIHHQWRPDQITHEPTLPTDIVEGLTKMGHTLKSLRTVAVAQGIQRKPEYLQAASDPRVDSSALGIP